eukprot:gene11216-biopygen6257
MTEHDSLANWTRVGCASTGGRTPQHSAEERQPTLLYRSFIIFESTWKDRRESTSPWLPFSLGSGAVANGLDAPDTSGAPPPLRMAHQHVRNVVCAAAYSN